MEIISMPSNIPENSLIPNDYNSENILGALALMSP